MSQESPAKEVRTGTRSCIECRHRKVRCVWQSEGAEICQGCSARGRTCKPQVQLRRTSETVRATSGARIRKLESEISSLWAAVRGLEARLACAPTEVSIQPHPSSQKELCVSPHENPSKDDNDSESDAFGMPPTSPPTHLLQLFDNGLLDSSGHESAATPSRGVNRTQNTQKSYVLRNLMPSREDMITIAAHASSWLFLQNALFPTVNMMKSGAEMLSQYDKLQDLNADLIPIATHLLYVAITVQQAPDDKAANALESIRDVSSFVKNVSDSVERIVIADDNLAGTLDGVETIMLFVRLCVMGGYLRGRQNIINDVVVTARNGELSSSKRRLLDSQGQVNPQSYLYNIANSASRVLEMENICSSGRPLTEYFNAVIGTDQELRSLASLTPKSWWVIQSELSIDALLQYWHQYLTVRTHLQLALKYDQGQEFAFNFIACLDASQELTRRYVSLRPVLPVGFFINRVIDLQVFTAAVFLLLASQRTTRGSNTFLQAVDINATTSLVDQVLHTMDAKGNFARHEADSIRSLRSLLQQPQTSEPQRITLNLALIGRIHVSRTTHAGKALPTQAYSAPSQPSQGTWQIPTIDQPALAAQAMSSLPPELDLMDSFSYSMEIPENYPLLMDENIENEQWLTLSGWDGNVE